MIQPTEPDDTKAILDKAQAAAKVAGITMEDVERVIREVRAEKRRS